MNDLDAHYNTYIEHRGRVYRYDPDFDCFYAVDRYKDMSTLEAWLPVILLLVMSAICAYIEYFH